MNDNKKKRYKILGITLLIAAFTNTAFNAYGYTYDTQMTEEQTALEEQQRIEENKKLEIVEYVLNLELQDSTLYDENKSIVSENGFYNSYDIQVVKINMSGTRYTIKHPYSDDNFIEIEINNDNTIDIFEVDNKFDKIRTIGRFSTGSVYIKSEALEKLYNTEENKQEGS